MKVHKKSRFFKKLLLLIILLVLTISTVYSYGGRSVVRPTVKNALESSAQVWSEIAKDSTITMKIKKVRISFTNLTFKTKNKVADVSIEVGSLKEKPSNLIEPLGILHQYVVIATDKIKEDDIEFVSINFKVSKEWINENDIDESSINLNRYIDNSWKKLKTNKRDFDSNYVYFNAMSPGFSVFAITGEKNIKKAEAVEETQKKAIESKDFKKIEPKQIEEEIEEPIIESDVSIPTPTVKKSKISTNVILIILILIILALSLFFFKKRKKFIFWEIQ